MRLIASLLSLLTIATCSAPDAPDVRVAAATNVKPALEAIIDAFEAEAGVRVTVTYGSTGKLTTQILNGAPFDVFLAADVDGPARLEAAGRVTEDGRRSYVIGSLVLWHPGVADCPGLAECLAAPDLRHLAIANPDLAPYGGAAMETLASLGVNDALAGRLVQGENIGQAFALVATGNAQAGFIARSQIANVEESWIPVDPGLHAPIVQDAVWLEGRDGAEARPEAGAFFDYLFSPTARAILAEHGYQAP